MKATKVLGTGIRNEKCRNEEQEFFTPQPHQENIKNYFLNSPYRGLLLYHSLGSGKCHAINTPIILSDGKIKMVQDINVGELLMGDDSTPRTVTSLARGEDEMYEIIPNNGESYTVNQEHILCLKAVNYPIINRTNTSYNVRYIKNNKFMLRKFFYEKNNEQQKKIEAEQFFNISKNNIIEISVVDYLKLSEIKKSFLKTYRVPVEFREQKVDIEAYNLITQNSEFIPDNYKYNSKENRLNLLASLIDRFGIFQNNYFEISILMGKENLINDIIYLSRSLGFASDRKDTCVIIRGKGIEKIPSKKYTVIESETEDVLVSSIKVKHIGRDNYYGFTLDGNCRYLLGDFTVTHNTCTSILIADEMLKKKMIKHVYVCTPGSLRKNFIGEYCNLCGEQNLLNKNFTFITYNTNIFKSLKKLDFNDSLVIIDEAHNLINGAKNITKNPYTLYNQILNSNARILILTATVIFNNVYEWNLIGNLLKDNTFPNIIKSGELNVNLFEKNKKEIFSKENLKGIISYFPGFMNEYPDVIYNEPIKVPMNVNQSLEWTKISEDEELRRIIGPPKPFEYRQNYVKANKKHTSWIMAQKYIVSRVLSNIHYLSFMIRKSLDKSQIDDVQYLLKNFFKTEEKIKQITELEGKKAITIEELIINELHLLADTYEDILKLNKTNSDIGSYIENKLIINKLINKSELIKENIDVEKIIDDEIYRMKKANTIEDMGDEDEIREEFVEEEEDKNYEDEEDIKEKKNYIDNENVEENEEDVEDYVKDKENDEEDDKDYMKEGIEDDEEDDEDDEDDEDYMKEGIEDDEEDDDEDDEDDEDEEDNYVKEDIEEDEDVIKQNVNDFQLNKDAINMCLICMELLSSGSLVYKLPCGDLFHYNCLKIFVKTNPEIENKCPICNIVFKNKIKKRDAIPNNYISVPDTFENEGGWISKEIFKDKLLMVISPKILTVILNILKNYDSKHVIFSYFVEKGGLKLIHNILKMCNINSVIYSGDLSPEKRDLILKKYNNKNNLYGNKIKVFLSTEAGFEGITLKEVGHVHFLETNTTPNKTIQAIGRAVRFQSHKRLPPIKRVVNVWKYFSTPILSQLVDNPRKIKKLTTLNESLNTFDEYYDYYVKGGYVDYLNENFGKNWTDAQGTDEILNNMSISKVEKFNEFYTILRENSIEAQGLIK